MTVTCTILNVLIGVSCERDVPGKGLKKVGAEQSEMNIKRKT